MSRARMTLTSDELAACDRVCRMADAVGHPYTDHTFNVHRWIEAYEGDEEEAAKILKRHLNLRECMRWGEWPDMQTDAFDDRVDTYAPLSILGSNHPDDNKVMLFEQSGKIDIHGLIENVKVTSFMRAKFRMMERIHRKVVEEEKRTSKQSGGMLVMDLQGLSFQPSLLTILAGPYRIMWGTLFEQYPQIIRYIVIINAPKFINLLYSTCIPFIPADYRERMIICSASDPIPTLLKQIHPNCLPAEYGGRRDEEEFEICQLPVPGFPFPRASDEEVAVELDQLSVSAGSVSVQTYRWTKGMDLQFLMKHDQEFTLFIFHSEQNTEDTTKWREIYAGCERPALKMRDEWKWKVPLDGFYHVRFGNEKAWFYSVTVQYRINERKADGSLVPQKTV